MVQLKRQAETSVTSQLQTKRQRGARTKVTAVVPQNHLQEDDFTGECQIDSRCVSLADDKLAASFAERLTAMNAHADQRKIWAKDFEAEVTTKKTSLVKKIEGAKADLEEKRDAFKRSVLPVLSAALQDFHLVPTQAPTTYLPLQIEITNTTKIVAEASHLLKSCQTIIACYEELVEADRTPSSTTRLRDRFTKDKRALEVAFSGAKKIVANHIQSRISHGLGDFRTRPELTEEEETFGQKVLKKSSIAQDRGSKSGVVLRDVCYDLGKVVGRMQHIVDM